MPSTTAPAFWSLLEGVAKAAGFYRAAGRIGLRIEEEYDRLSFEVRR